MNVTIRDQVRAGDPEIVEAMVRSTGFFHEHETRIARELAEEALAKGSASGYHFVFLERADEPVAYACYGEIPCTRGSWDLYWIVVHARARANGLGRRTCAEVEQRIRARGGRLLFAETSGRDLYAPTRTFYAKVGFTIAAEIPEFYDAGDSKVIYVKWFGPVRP